MDPLFEIRIDRAAMDARGSARSLHEQLRQAILDGRLRPGSRLPSRRSSRAFYGVSRNTAVEAYERLASEGYVVSRHGSGTFVADPLPPPRQRTGPKPGPSADPRLNQFWLRPEIRDAIGFWRDRPEGAPAAASTAAFDFRPALIDSRLFPLDLFRRVSSRQLRVLEVRPPSFKSAQGNRGNFALRDAITRHIALTRAVVCTPDDTLVTAGAQQAFDILARVLVSPGETVVALEDPGYPPMRVAFAAAGARIVPVPVDGEGIAIDRIPDDVDVICVCPSHHFPLGVTMTEARREALVDFARARGAVIIEDDYDGEFRYDGSPLEALRTADNEDVVFYVGTFSKCMLPALRLGFIVAPQWAIETLTTAKNCLDWHAPLPIQASVAGFIADGHLMRHVRKMRRVYGARRERLVKAIERDFAEWLEPLPSLYGMHVAVKLRRKVDTDAVAVGLLADNVKLHSLTRYFLGPATLEGFVLGYGVVGVEQIEAGLARLRDAMAKQAG
jgi:GntR family transcriptional regulator/MocR family aminotransferase